MIDNNSYKKVLDSGLSLDHYHVLCSIKDGKELPKNKRIGGFVNLLTKKGYLVNGELSDNALELVDNYVATTESCVTEQPVKNNEGKIDFHVWAKCLYKKCQDKLKELTGSTQVRDKINRKAYSFLPNSIDLEKVIYKVILLYKIKDLDKIEKHILHYIEKCNSAKNWFPILRYYILKDNESRLVTDMESDDMETITNKSSQKFV